MRNASKISKLVLIALVLSALALGGCAQVSRARQSTSLAGSTTAERTIYNHINDFRASRGLKSLDVHSTLVSKARNVAKFMAAGGCGLGPGGVPKICHSSLTEGITVRWALLAENVGSASPKTNLVGVAQAFQNSPGHAANILNRDIDYVGVGIAYWGNYVYVAEEFMAA